MEDFSREIKRAIAIRKLFIPDLDEITGDNPETTKQLINTSASHLHRLEYAKKFGTRSANDFYSAAMLVKLDQVDWVIDDYMHMRRVLDELQRRKDVTLDEWTTKVDAFFPCSKCSCRAKSPAAVSQ